MDASMVMDREQTLSPYLAEDRSGVLVGISVAFAVLTTVVLALRLYAKRFQGGGFFVDDAFTIASYIVNLGMCAVGITITKVGGVGRHVEYIKEFQPSALTGWAQCLLAFEFVYFTSVALPKLAIIFLYLRLFSWKGTMRAIAWVLIVLVALTSVSLVISAAFQCIPIAYWWDRTIPGGHCFDIQSFFHAQALPGFMLDLAIIALPMETIWRLNLPFVKRVALLMVFAIGSFGIVASIIRATIFFGTSAFSDETMASVDLIGWSIIETSVYIITNCLPHLRPLVSHHAPGWLKQAFKSTFASFGTHADRTKGYSKGSALKSLGQSRKGQDTRHEDDMIELTWRKGDVSQLSRSGSSCNNNQETYSPVWEGGEREAQDMASKTEIKSTGEPSQDIERSGSTPLGSITVTREVKLTRS